jgi:hypothetical protein
MAGGASLMAFQVRGAVPERPKRPPNAQDSRHRARRPPPIAGPHPGTGLPKPALMIRPVWMMLNIPAWSRVSAPPL